MSWKHKLLLFVACLALFPVPAPAQEDFLAGVPQKHHQQVRFLQQWINRLIAEKKIPALSIALVDDQDLVWAQGFGYADSANKIPATAGTVYRVGSVSKPHTALLLMLFVEMGLIDLDVPVQRYLPDFKPGNRSKKNITLRQILCHKSGLVRETPVGSYFDATEPTLAQTIASMNQTELVYEPETKTSYSNAAVAVAGRVLEVTQKEDFARLSQRKLLDPLGMTSSGFALTPELRKNLAQALMWTMHGRTFPAPPFELGMPSAGNLYSTVKDQAKLQSFLFARGKGRKGQTILKAETLEKMWQVQFAKEGEKTGFGLSFYISEFEGRRKIGHGGAVYGFATDFSALPDDKLGVVVVASLDVANGVTSRIAEVALKQMLAIKAGKPLPEVEETSPVPVDLARKLAGRYGNDKMFFDLYQRDGRLWLLSSRGGARLELRRLGDGLVVDDLLTFGTKLSCDGKTLKFNKDTFERVEVPRPAPPAEKWAGLIGEYGPDHNILYILEKDGKLHALIEWVFFYPLTEIAPDVYQFPDFGLYHGDKIVFHRDKAGRAARANAANVLFERRNLLGEKGETFQIQPVRPVKELRQAALAAQPLEEKNVLFKKPDLVDLTKLDATIKLDIRYATADNFLGTPVYTSARAFLQRPAAEALARAHTKLADRGFGLLIHDAYRPWHVTKIFYDATPEKYRLFVADPLQGSRHNRGCAVDLTLYDLQTGKAVDMVGGYDEFSDRSYPDYLGGASRQRWQRDLLRQAVEEQGFTVYHAEWWHFDYRDWRQYPILNVPFEKIP